MTPTNEQIPLFKCETSRNRLDIVKAFDSYGGSTTTEDLKPISERVNHLEDQISRLELAQDTVRPMLK
jgi:hypothetical protein